MHGEPVREPWCHDCPLRRATGFHEFTETEVGFMHGFKAKHLRLPAGADLFRQGEASTHLFTLFSGWAYRYRLLSDGRRQVMGIMLPGELAGASGATLGRHAHSLRAATQAEFCGLAIDRLPELLRDHAGLAQRLIWLGCFEERKAEEQIVMLGRCGTDGAIASLIVNLHDRLARRGMLDTDGSFGLPLSQADLADHLGITVVHLNRVLRLLERKAVAVVRRQRVTIIDSKRLRALSCLHEPEDKALPFL